MTNEWAVRRTSADAGVSGDEVAKPATIAAAYDALSGAEVEYVRFVGAQDAAFAAGEDVFGEPGMQFLSTDVADPQAYTDGQRRLISLYYDYATNETVSMIVNATTGAVEAVDRASGTQPAPTDAETSLAWELLLDADAAQPVVDEFAALTGGSVLTPASVTNEWAVRRTSADAGVRTEPPVSEANSSTTGWAASESSSSSHASEVSASVGAGCVPEARSTDSTAPDVALTIMLTVSLVA